ncbi:DUF6665 family protein [Ensifer soli]|uniref:DUF6665 family protein n=1 Tax=Ciceribacter sp. sgz301302 TaxID=3342379 RepID=UPI0035B930BC
MSVRPPQSLHRPAAASGPLAVLEYELMAERADALGRCGQKVEAALAALERERGAPVPDPARTEALRDAAADVVWAFFIQREICGLRNSRDAIARYNIPKEVIARLGVVRRP